MSHSIDYDWPQELEFWKAYVGVNGDGHGTATLAGGELLVPPSLILLALLIKCMLLKGMEEADCEALLEGMHEAILGTVRVQVRNTGWLNWGINAQNVSHNSVTL